MFGMGFSEIFFIAIIAIIFLGPEKLPDAMVKIAKLLGSVKKSVTDAKQSIETELNMHDLREDALSYKRNISDDISGFKNAMSNSVVGLDDLLEQEQNSIDDKQKSIEAPKKTTKKKETKPKSKTKKSTPKKSTKKLAKNEKDKATDTKKANS